MNCTVCGSNGWINSVLMTKPDMYEKWMGVSNVKRRWRKCLGCGLWHHWRNYPLEELEKIYMDGYRNPKFRGETIEQAFERVVRLPVEKSENKARIEWAIKTIEAPDPLPKYRPRLLDIGSGLGVFPYEMSRLGADVWCVEQNKDSVRFINQIGIKCTEKMPGVKFDAVSLVHVLEHIETPVEFLRSLHGAIKKDGKLFIEVPDAIEFELLFPTHDDFNSCHTHFYDIPSLYKVLGRAEYNVIDIHREHYKERNLHRIMAVCQKM